MSEEDVEENEKKGRICKEMKEKVNALDLPDDIKAFCSIFLQKYIPTNIFIILLYFYIIYNNHFYIVCLLFLFLPSSLY